MRALILALLACGSPSPAPAPVAAPDPCAGPFASASLYNVTMDLETADGSHACLAKWRGHPVIVSMFYASCPSMCPLTIQHIQAMLDRLSPAARDDVRVVLVSFDTAHDDPAALRALAGQRGLDTTRWTLARAPEDQVRELSAALGVSYRHNEDGGFDHTAVFTALDRDGVPVARVDGLGEPDDALVEAIGAAR